MAEPDEGAETGSPKPVESIEADAHQGSTSLTDEQWKAMSALVMSVDKYKEEDGNEPAHMFRRKVNKRYIPDYYDVIKEPMALSTLKEKINKKLYKDFPGFVHDCALIWHNAQTYNRPRSRAYEDALTVKGVFENAFNDLIDKNVVSSEMAAIPDLGPIPEADPLPDEDEEEEEEEEDEDEEDEEPEESEEEGGRRKRKRGPRSNAAIAKRESGAKDEGGQKADPESRKKRGRPPRVDTPMEARIKAILKGIRKFKDSQGHLKVRHFDRLPDKSAEPGYFAEIKEPIAIDLIKRKSKRKKYQSVEHFMKDMDLMFNNAKDFNVDESQIFKDAVDLQQEAHKLADQEKRKPDSEYLMEDGRLPLPNGILHNGELWKVGDWVHIQNPNDVTKPIVAQIYRTWQDVEGQKWVNACWYYRPEQTVHQFEKHFFPNEVVKTGQYRDHHVDEVVDRCFVMFFTRYNRGRPRGFPADKEVYVCEARYNEDKFKLNKIKTWASCLPDEVREKDYEMDLFDAPRKIKKIPSPIKHLLKDDAKETDDLPQPTWGAGNAPPIVGAVHRRPREENESPPPEPTPSPPPPPPPQPVRQMPPQINRPPARQSLDSQGDVNMSGTPTQPAMPLRSPAQMPHSQLPHNPHQPNYHQHSASPAPAYQPNNYGSSHIAHNQYQPQTPNHAPFNPPLPPSSHHNQYSTPQQHNYAAVQANRHGLGQPLPYNPSQPRPVEVYQLSDAANLSIPGSIRSQFQTDDAGRVLFFTAPPLDPVTPIKQGMALGHTPAYLVAKAKRQELIAEKKKREAEATKENDLAVKKAKVEEDRALNEKINELTGKAVTVLAGQIEKGTADWYRMMYGDEAEQMMEADSKKRERQVQEERLEAERSAEFKSKLQPNGPVSLKGTGVFLDDADARY